MCFCLVLQKQLQWRLVHWLDEGSKIVEPLLPELTLPVVVLAGSEDHILPSIDEAARLDTLIPTCQPVRSLGMIIFGRQVAQAEHLVCRTLDAISSRLELR